MEQEIPDDGSWLKICWNDASAPLESTIIKTNVKYEVEHPDISQLEVQLIHDGVSEPVTLWDSQKTEKERETFGEILDLETFKDSAGIGNWYLMIRDTVPDGTGKLVGFTIISTYYLEGPKPELLSEGIEGVEATAIQLPPDAIPNTDPDIDPPKIEIKSLQNIKSETFEGAFPNTYWTLYDYSNDGYQRIWNDSSYKPHNGFWAGWPAAGGTNAVNPSTSNYPANMDSWMVYGPFDLSDAATAETVFWLWRQMQASYDYLFFGISSDGVNYQGFNYYGNNSTIYNWSQINVAMNNYVGDSTVWVAWKFYSNSSIQYQGPWVDDILISKEVPGYVTVNGTLTYQDRDGSPKPGAFTRVKLYEHDPAGTSDLLAVGATDTNGSYSFSPILNWDNDGDADPTNRKLDLYVVFEAIYYDSPTSYHQVTELNGIVRYYWDSALYSNVPSTNINRSLHISLSNFPDSRNAMWIFQDLWKAWQFTFYNTSPQIDAGSATARWENLKNCDVANNHNQCNSYFNINTDVFISHQHSISADVVVHEIGHNYKYNTSGPSNPNCPIPHYITQSSNKTCAWEEGWANYFAVAANASDNCFDFNIIPCIGVNLETIGNADVEDEVEGRVASALLDLYDVTEQANNDFSSHGFAPIGKVVLQGGAEYTFEDFWTNWKSNQNEKHNAVRTIYYNTIDYNNPPVLSLPDWNVPHDSAWPNAFSLFNYVSDEESLPSQITWQITSSSSPNCGVSIDAQKNIDIASIPNWTGSCTFTITAYDTLEYGYDVFTVYVTQASFADVPTSHIMYAQIESMFSNGITTGCANDPRRYCPNNTVDRGQMAVFLLKGMYGGSYTPPSATGTMFADVPITHQFAAWIEQLANEGITAGCGGGNYCPSNSVTRAQMAIFLLRAKHGASYSPPPATGTMFADVPVNAFAAAWIEQLANEGITSGCGGGNFCPNNSVTRAQMAVFLVNTFNLP